MKLAGKEYTPRFPLMSCVELEGATSQGLGAIARECFERPMNSLGLSLALVWASILAEDKALTVQQVSDMFEREDSDSLGDCFVEVVSALTRDMKRMISPRNIGAEKN